MGRVPVNLWAHGSEGSLRPRLGLARHAVEGGRDPLRLGLKRLNMEVDIPPGSRLRHPEIGEACAVYDSERRP